ncbi:MAG: hypothetical protein AVDCRST_MAG87-2450, partial [uncultured Thermomicrobiales bacterium]
ERSLYSPTSDGQGGGRHLRLPHRATDPVSTRRRRRSAGMEQRRGGRLM